MNEHRIARFLDGPASGSARPSYWPRRRSAVLWPSIATKSSSRHSARARWRPVSASSRSAIPDRGCGAGWRATWSILGALAAALKVSNRRAVVGAALASVVGITALDIACGLRFTNRRALSAI